MECENCEREAMSEDSRFCEPCAKAFRLGYTFEEARLRRLREEEA